MNINISANNGSEKLLKSPLLNSEIFATKCCQNTPISFAISIKGQRAEWPLSWPQWKSKRNRSLVTPRGKEEDNIKMDLSELRVRGCKQDSSSLWEDQGAGLVNKDMHIRLQLIRENFFFHKLRYTAICFVCTNGYMDQAMSNCASLRPKLSLCSFATTPRI